jgi:kynurenine formamidase
MDPDPASILGPLELVRAGRLFRLARTRFPGMPLGTGHPPFQVLSYRSPDGLRVAGEEPFGPVDNRAEVSYTNDLLMSGAHSGAHIDALAHIVVGKEQRWHGGVASENLGDFGPLRGDAAEIPPLWCRGVLFDVAGHRGLESLPAGSPIGADELAEIAAAKGLELGRGDVALIRTGHLADWPDAERMRAHGGAGPDASAAAWLAERGIVATGSDTEAYEALPAPAGGPAGNPMPVHSILLVEHGIFIMEMLYLEELAAAGIGEFLFVALPLGIRGATASMIDPIAVA